MRVKKEINIQIGNQIKYAREKAKLTQEQFAECVDVSPQFVSDLERGVVGISLATLKRVCLALGVSSDQIIFGKQSEKHIGAIEEKCRGLTDRQFSILLEIIEKYIDAVSKE